MKLGPWLDRLLTLAVVLTFGTLAYRYLLPRPSAPLETLSSKTISEPGQVTLFELGATYCAACVAMRPIVGLVAKNYQGRVRVQVLNVDQPADRQAAAELSALAGLRYTPTFVVAGSDGKAHAKFIGPTSYLALAQALDQALRLPPPSPLGLKPTSVPGSSIR